MKTCGICFCVVSMVVAGALSVCLLCGCGGGGGGGGGGVPVTVSVTGRVRDEITGVGIKNATVTIGSLTTTTSSRDSDKGTFRLDGVATGSRTVVVSAIDYDTLTRRFNILDAAQSQNLGDLLLEEEDSGPPPPPVYPPFSP